MAVTRKNVTKEELRKRILELSPEMQREVCRFIEFLIWKRQREILEKVSDSMLLEEVNRRKLVA